MVNTILNTICAKKFKEFAGRIDAGEKPEEVAREALHKHFKVIFNKDSYNLENQEMLTEKGLPNTPSGVEVIHRLRAKKNLDLI